MKTIIMIPGLSDKEQLLYELLHDISEDNIWNDAIQLFLRKPSLPGFRQLVSDLKSQCNDNPQIMKSILGEKCFEALQNLFS